MFRIGTFSLFGLLILGMAGAGAPARAGSNLVMNGDFEQTSLTTSAQMNATNVTGWSTAGYNFLYLPGTADTTGAQTVLYGCCTKLWGPGDGSNNGLTPTSPTGGNFIGADGAFTVGAITQTVSGLTIGTNYTLSFWWAAGQQQGFTGATTESWNVSFGTQNYSTVTVTTPSMGFTPWRMDTVVFQASATSQVLSFLAAGTPGGQPPFSLLDGVSLVAGVTEPASGLLMVAGIALLLATRRRPPTRDHGCSKVHLVV